MMQKVKLKTRGRGTETQAALTALSQVSFCSCFIMTDVYFCVSKDPEHKDIKPAINPESNGIL